MDVEVRQVVTTFVLAGHAVLLCGSGLDGYGRRRDI